jgi:hypothetical protein
LLAVFMYLAGSVTKLTSGGTRSVGLKIPSGGSPKRSEVSWLMAM